MRPKRKPGPHTPGPWVLGVGAPHCFHAGNRVAVVGHATDDSNEEETEFTIAEVWSTCDDTDIADGHLIAAAPDLLAALEALLVESMVDPEEQRDLAARQAQARAAVDKARGKL